MGKSEDPKIRNFCAKWMNHFNKPKTEVDRKRQEKSGYEKHKKRMDGKDE